MRTAIALLGTASCILTLAGCGASDSLPPPGLAAGAGQARPPAAAQQAAFKSDFETQRRRIELEHRRQAELERRRRSFVTVEFQEIHEDGRVIVTVTNSTTRDIDDIRGGFHAEDASGNYLASTGFTEAVPGDVFLAAGQTRIQVPYNFGSKEKLIDLLGREPHSVQFFFEALAITYADGSQEAGLEY